VSQPLACGVTYLPAATGVHLWREFRPARAAADLATLRAQGFDTVRVHLAWDAFMPSHRQVDRHRLRDLETLLQAARGAGVRVVPVLFAQSFGDCVLLPAYASRRRPRRGVRVISDGVVQPGGPRDLYGDPLMVELSVQWLTALLDAFANHPAVAAWDLGHDPATTVRPRRIAQLASWVELLAGAVRARKDQVELTLGAADVLSARGVRLAAVAPHVDALGLVVLPQTLAFGGSGARSGDAVLPLTDSAAPDMAGVVFTVQLALRLAGEPGHIPPLHVVTGMAVGDDAAAGGASAAPVGSRKPGGGAAAPEWELPLLAPEPAATRTAELLDRLVECGVAGILATSWCEQHRRALEAPPLDRSPSLARHGLVTAAGELRRHGEVWTALSRREAAVGAAAPWPPQLEAGEYYANLPDSGRELYDAWRRDVEGA